jgi:hypothetical protein
MSTPEKRGFDAEVGMDYCSCWKEDAGLSLHAYTIAVLLSFDVALLAYRVWRARQLDFVQRFSLSARDGRALR